MQNKSPKNNNVFNLNLLSITPIDTNDWRKLVACMVGKPLSPQDFTKDMNDKNMTSRQAASLIAGREITYEEVQKALNNFI
jgi:hypothetical protein